MGLYGNNEDIYEFRDSGYPLTTVRIPMHVLKQPAGNDYIPLTVLGQGAQSDVVLMMKTGSDNDVSAAKIFSFDYKDKKKSERRRRQFFSELEILKQIDHQNVLKIESTVITDFSGTLFLKWIDGGSLASKLKHLSQGGCEKVFVQIACAVRYIHNLGIVHRDIKPHNILIEDDFTAYLTDFGLAQTVPQPPALPLVKGFIGTRGYMAPELENAENNSVKIDGKKADAYSLGLTIVAMTTKQHPAVGVNFWPFKYVDKQVNLAYCARCLLKENPETRFSVTRLLNDLRLRGFCSPEIGRL